ncbi:MAG TPA: hypothetical protein VKR06_05125 [Ktedonosporobacter sp.]|nr:hypothetical protein [Ktedonosporobacter sp.]
MKEQHDDLQPETIDQVLEDGVSWPPDRQTTRLIQHLQSGSQEYARANEHSLDRIWSRLAQSQKHPVFLQAQWKRPEKKLIVLKERKVMQDHTDIYPPIYLSQPKKGRSFLRAMGLGLIAAVAIVAMASFALFPNLLRSAAQTVNRSTITGAAQQQQGITNGKQVCSFAGGTNGVLQKTLWAPSLAWSTQGQIAVAGYSTLKVISAQDCSATYSKTLQNYLASWSPDGKQLVTADADGAALNVLDTKGNTLAHLSFAKLGAISVGPVMWSSDSKKLIYVAFDTLDQSSIKSVDVASGSGVTTLLKLPVESGVLLLMPDGKSLVLEHLNRAEKKKDIEIWNIDSGKKTSTVSFSPQSGNVQFFSPVMQSISADAISPDGSQLALGTSDHGTYQVQIYDTTSGKLQTSFDASTWPITALSWSPDGKYLAESTSAIHIYDVNAQKTVATFGNVDEQHMINTLAWSPDSKGLVSSTTLVKVNDHSQNTVTVWGLN